MCLFLVMWVRCQQKVLYLLIARVATAYYFLHFLVILPVLGFKEKTLPVPLSITEPVLGGSPNYGNSCQKTKKVLKNKVKNLFKILLFFLFLL